MASSLFTSAHRSFDPSIEDREALLFVARALCDDIATELGLRGAGASRFSCGFSSSQRLTSSATLWCAIH